METTNLGLKKFDLNNEPNATMNVETYFNSNWDKLDVKAKQVDDLIKSEANAVEAKIDAAKAETRKLKEELDQGALLDFACENKRNIRYPEGAKGAFNPRVEGGKPLYNYADNGINYENWTVLGTNSKKDKNGIHLVIDSGNELASIPITNLKSGLSYTLVYEIRNSNADYALSIHGEYSVFPQVDLPSTNGIHRKVLSVDDPTKGKVGFYFYSGTDGKAIDLKVLGIYVGDHTNNPNIDIEHPHGVISDVQSYCLVSRGQNLFNKNEAIMDGNRINEGDGKIYKEDVDELNAGNGYSDYIEIDPNSPIKLLGGDTPRYCPMALYNSKKEFITGSTTPNFNITTPYNAKYVRFSIHEDDLERIMLIQGSQSPEGYVPYVSSQTMFTVPEEYPLIQLPSGNGNIIDDNGDYIVNVRKVPLKDCEVTNVTQTLANDNGTLINTYLVSVTGAGFNVRKGIGDVYAMKKDALLYSTSLGPIEHNLNYTADEMHFYMGDTPTNIIIFIEKSILDEKSGAKLEEKAKECISDATIYYQLSEPLNLKDGEKGYSAPTSIQAYDNGDLIVRPIVQKPLSDIPGLKFRMSLNDFKIIGAPLDNAKKDIGKLIEKDGTEFIMYKFGIGFDKAGLFAIDDYVWLSVPNSKWNGKSETDEGVKEYIKENPMMLTYEVKHSKQLFPKIVSQIPSNIGTVSTNNAKSISVTNKKVLSLEQKMDLLIVLNS